MGNQTFKPKSNTEMNNSIDSTIENRSANRKRRIDEMNERIIRHLDRFEPLVKAFFTENKVSSSQEITLELLQRPCRHDIDRFIIEKAMGLDYRRKEEDSFDLRLYKKRVMDTLISYEGPSDILPLKERSNFFWSIRVLFEKYIEVPIPCFPIPQLSCEEEKARAIMQEALTKLEHELKLPCQLSLQPIGFYSNQKITVGELKDRRDIKKIIVRCIDDKYKDLEGEYDSYQDLEKKVDYLKSVAFDRLTISHDSDSIYTSGGGSLSVCTDVCIIRYIFADN